MRSNSFLFSYYYSVKTGGSFGALILGDILLSWQLDAISKRITFFFEDVQINFLVISDFVILILLTETRCDNVGKQSKEGQVFNLPLLVNALVNLDYVNITNFYLCSYIGKF